MLGLPKKPHPEEHRLGAASFCSVGGTALPSALAIVLDIEVLWEESCARRKEVEGRAQR